MQLATVEEETTHSEETALDRAVAALTIHVKKKWHRSKSQGEERSRGSQGGGRGSGQSQKALCNKHERFGEYAHCSLLLQPQDLLLGGKPVGRGVAVAATPDGKPGGLALLWDSGEGRSCLVDTGSAYSILPFSSTAQTTGPALTAASGASMKAWGRRRVQAASQPRP